MEVVRRVSSVCAQSLFCCRRKLVERRGEECSVLWLLLRPGTSEVSLIDFLADSAACIEPLCLDGSRDTAQRLIRLPGPSRSLGHRVALASAGHRRQLSAPSRPS
jgi:hypothetical protein